MVFSAFEEILYLDSATLPVTRPDDVFESANYQNAGAVVWPDFWQSSEKPWAAYCIGLSNTTIEQRQRKRHTLDDRLMLWNKKKHWKVIAYVSPKHILLTSA